MGASSVAGHKVSPRGGVLSDEARGTSLDGNHTRSPGDSAPKAMGKGPAGRPPKRARG